MKKLMKSLAVFCLAAMTVGNMSGLQNSGAEISAYPAAEAAMTAKANESEKNIATDDFEVEGGTFELTEEGYESGNAVKIVPSKQTTRLYLTLPSLNDKAEYEKVHVSFRLFSEGQENTYDDYMLSTWGDTLIDYAYPKGVWNLVSFDSQIFKRGGKNAVLVQFDKALGETLKVSDILADDDTFDDTNLLGGIEMFQLASPSRKQNESFVILTPEKYVAVMDGGRTEDAEYLFNFLNRYTTKVDAWFVSHFHSDHIGALITLLNEYDISIDTLYYDFRGASNDDWVGDSENFCITDLNEAVENHPEKVKNVVTTKAGDVFTYGSMTMKVLNDGYFGPGVNPGNDSSVVFKMETPKESVLFCGDLGVRGDVYLNDPAFAEEIGSCRVVQLGHHGQNGCTEKFYRAIDDIKVCLYCAPDWLYDVIKDGVMTNPIGSGPWGTLRQRTLMRELGVRVSYSSKNGDIVIY